MALETLIQQERGPLVARLTYALGGDRETAEELVQETMLRAWQRLPPHIAPGQQRAWLSRTAKHLAIDELRRRGRRPTAALEEADGGSEDDVLGAGAIDEAMAKLTPHERFVMMLRFDAGFSHAEVARLLDISEEAARKRAARARVAFLRAYRRAQGESDPLILLVIREDTPDSYVRWLERSGARVRLVWSAPTERELTLSDGIVFTGGYVDLHAGLYGEAPRHIQGDPDLTADRADLAVMQGALALDLPIVGVCRGGQLLNIASGGTLYQDVVDDGLTTIHHSAEHRVQTARGAIARRLLGSSAEVSSYHHQAVRRLGTKLAVSATSPDGVIETIERTDRRFALGLQWHPEFGDDDPGERVAEALVEAARERVA